MYRRNLDDSVWHWQNNCEKWPVGTFEETPIAHTLQPPLAANFCNQCLAIEGIARLTSNALR